MKALLVIAALLAEQTVFAENPVTITNVWSIAAPPIKGEISCIGEPSSPFGFGSRIGGLRIGLWSESAKYVLNHRMNIWTMMECERAIERDDPILKEGFLWVTMPGGVVSKVQFDPINTSDGPTRWVRAGGGISDLLHRIIRTPGEYKIQWKIDRLESGIVSFTVLPETPDQNAAR